MYFFLVSTEYCIFHCIFVLGGYFQQLQQFTLEVTACDCGFEGTSGTLRLIRDYWSFFQEKESSIKCINF